MTLSRLMIIAGILMVTLVLTGVIIHLTSGNKGHCQPQEAKPDKVREEELINRASLDFKSIANIDGYIEYHNSNEKEKDSKPTYLPIGFDTFDVADGEKVANGTINFNSKSAMFEGECSKIQIYFVQDDIYYRAISAKLHLEHPVVDINECSIDLTSASARMQMKIGQHYWCDSVQTFDCSSKGKTVVKLILSHIELEIDGNEKTIREGNFDPDKQVCSEF